MNTLVFDGHRKGFGVKIIVLAAVSFFPGIACLASDNWDSRFVPPPVTDGEIYAMASQGGNVYVGGNFAMVNGVSAQGIAKWNGTAWESVGGGVDGDVNAIAISGTNVYIGGTFDQAGSVSVMNVALWNGSAWSDLGGGIDNDTSDASVGALSTSGTNLFVGGVFTMAGETNATNVARWNGTAWTPLGRGITYLPADTNDTTTAAVGALAYDGTNLYAGGSFNRAGIAAATNIAKWNGSSWSAVGSGLDYVPFLASDTNVASVWSLAVSSGNLYAGGIFNTAGSAAAQNLAIWNGSKWAAVGGPVDDGVASILIAGTGIYIGGVFSSVDSVTANGVAHWNGSNWEALGSGIDDGYANALAMVGNAVFAAGSFDTVGDNPAASIARWNGIGWEALGNGSGNSPQGDVNRVLIAGANIYVGGDFSGVGSVAANNLALWNGGGWQPLGTGVDGPVNDIATNGTDVYVGGLFTQAGSVSATNIAKWNGVSWQSLGNGLDDGVRVVLVSGTNIYIGGDFINCGGTTLNYVAHWNGGGWEPLGGGVDGPVNALALNGSNLFVGGDFSFAGGVSAANIACWNGSTWSSVGGGMSDEVCSLALLGSNLYAGGLFATAGANTNANGVARWDGVSWSDLAGGFDDVVSQIAVAGTNLFAAGAFTSAGTNATPGIAKWTGASWISLGDGLDDDANTISAQGNLVCVGGPFTTAGEEASYHFGIWNDALPSIWLEPGLDDSTFSAGTNFTLAAAASGNAPLSYQWQRNGANIAGATGSTLTRTNIQSADAGFYTVVVSNAFGMATSMPVDVQFDSAVVFSEDFESGKATNWTTFSGGTAMTISTAQSHGGTYSALCSISSAKMFHNLGTELDGHCLATFWIYDDQGTQNRWFGEVRGYSGAGVGSGTVKQVLSAGLYNAAFGTNETGDFASETVVSTNYQGQVSSGGSRGYFNLNDPPDPGRSTGWHKFQIERQADGVSIDYYVDDEWRRGVSDATDITWDSALIGSVGSGSVAGSVWFDDIRIEYLDPPDIVTPPGDCLTNAGATVTFSVHATNNAQSYQWRRNGVNLAGATASKLSLSNVQQTNAGAYSVLVGNGVGFVCSDDALLTLYTAPSILGQPQSQTAAAGANVALAVAASGSPSSLYYQWRLNGSSVSGATASELALLDIAAGNAGSYSVVITNAAGSVTSAVAVLTITNSKPMIMIQPQAQIIGLGGNATFAVGAIGNEPRSYQWQFNGVNIAGATASGYRKVALQGSDAGSYSVIVSNAFGAAISSNAVLSLTFPPVISAQPASLTVSSGANVSFQVVAGGTAPLAYEWRANNWGMMTYLDGDDTLVLNNVQSADSGTYSVMVYNGTGRALSSNAVLTVNGPPSILSQPQSLTVSPGSNATFSVTAVGSGTLSYQWVWNGADLAGATLSAYTRTNVQSKDVAVVSVRVSSPYGTTASEGAFLQLDGFAVFSDDFESGLGNWTTVSNATALSLSSVHANSPSNSALCAVSSGKMYHNLAVKVENHRLATFWIYDDGGSQTVWFGEVRAQSGSFGTGLQQILNIGRYDDAFPTNQTGELAFEDTDTNYYQGQVWSGTNSGYLNLNDDGAPTRSVGWHQFQIEQTTDDTVTFYVDGAPSRTIDQTTDADWDSAVIGSSGSGSISGNVWFDDVRIEYLDPPLILSDPQDVLVGAGQDASFSVSATGNVVGYQWRFEGTNIPGATNSSFTLTHVDKSNAGAYSVVVMNGVGLSLSGDAALTVADPPSILAQPQSQTIRVGLDATFTVGASGTDPLLRQWRKNGAAISGATDDSLVLPQVSFSDAGTYSVIVSNLAGTVESSDAILTVRSPQAPQFGGLSLNNAQIVLTLSGEAGGSYSIQMSSNLVDWIPAQALVLSNGSFQFLDSLTNRCQFYRATGP